MQKPTQALKSVKGPENIFDWHSNWAKTLPSLIYFSWDIYRDAPVNKQNFKYQSWYLTPYCGLEVQKPTQALKSVKRPGNIFDWHCNWARTLPSLIYVCNGIFIETTSLHKQISNIKVDIWHPTVGLRCRHTPRHLSQLKAREIPLIGTPSGQELCRP